MPLVMFGKLLERPLGLPHLLFILIEVYVRQVKYLQEVALDQMHVQSGAVGQDLPAAVQGSQDVGAYRQG